MTRNTGHSFILYMLKITNMKPLNNQILLTEHFDIYQSWNHLICYFEIAMPDGTYKLWEFLDHKVHNKNTWKLK